MIRIKRLYAHDFKQLRQIDLKLPEAGRILVQGKNEAGKSTLFEAIFFGLFGQALATESGGAGRANLDDLIGYDKNKARVELDIAVRDRLFHIVRTLNRDKPNVWQLDIVNGEHIEEVRGNRAVNDRLVSELGLDSEALLNTCFVEQKKLEKLEGLNRGKREESLSKLLNLERLLDLEEKIKLKGEDEKLVTRLIKRAELAAAQEELPGAEDELRVSEGRLRLIELRTLAARAADEKRAIVELAAQIQTLRSERDELRAAVDRVNTLDRARQAMGVALERFGLLAQEATALEARRSERVEIERGINEQLPVLQVRARGLARLSQHLYHLNQVENARAHAAAELVRLQGLEEELGVQTGRRETLTGAIGTLELDSGHVDALLRDYEFGEALGQWAAASNEVNAQRDMDRLVQVKTRARDEAQAELRVGLIVPGVLLVGLAVSTIFIPLAILLLTGSTIVAVGAGAALLVADAVLGTVLIRWALHVWDQLQQATEELGQVEGEAAMRREMARAAEERLTMAEARLREFGAPVPASADAAQVRRAEIARTLENRTREELNAARDSAHAKLSYARAQHDETAKRIQALEIQIAAGNPIQQQHRIDKAERIASRWRPLLSTQAMQLQVEPDLQAVRSARQEIESERRNWQARIKQAKNLAQEIEQGGKRIQKLELDLQTAYHTATGLLGTLTPTWQSGLPRDYYVQVEQELARAFEAHGGNQVRNRLNEVDRELGACEREHKMREQSARSAVAEAQAIVQQLALNDALPAQPEIKDLDALTTRLNELPTQDRDLLQSRIRILHQRVGILQDTCRRLSTELNLPGETLDPIAARDELEKERRTQRERKVGSEIVLLARKRIVQKVLPATMEYMRRILPQLTRDRYHDAELDPENYKIKVWDERAGQSGTWKEKNIFSGGTKDQFSLALRLAFALATLPQERGASPGFIFLDEPLGSFDDERAASLLYLLTDGEIGRAFEQILLISHVRVDESRFTHHIRLENGVVVETDLETGGTGQ